MYHYVSMPCSILVKMLQWYYSKLTIPPVPQSISTFREYPRVVD